MIDFLAVTGSQIWTIILMMAPYVLLGFLLAGLLRLVLSPGKVSKYMGPDNPFAVFWAALLGVPLPLCSCGILPVAASLRKSGAGRGAVAAFLLSAPQTGIENIIATYGILGWGFALWRPVQAFLMGIAGGSLVKFFCSEDTSAADGDKEICKCHCGEEKSECHCHDTETDCCHNEESSNECCCLENQEVCCCAETTESECCCHTEETCSCHCHDDEEECHCGENRQESEGCCEKNSECHCHDTETDCCCKEPSAENPVVSALIYAFWDLPKEIGGHLLLGILLGGIFSAVISPGLLQHSLGGILGQMLFAVLLGLPMYVCSNASIPIAYAMIGAGFEPAAALVFMVTGPETNLAALTVIHKLLGTKGLAVYLMTVIVFACLCGALLNGFLRLHSAAPDMMPHSYSLLWGALLLLILSTGLVRKILNK